MSAVFDISVIAGDHQSTNVSEPHWRNTLQRRLKQCATALGSRFGAPRWRRPTRLERVTDQVMAAAVTLLLADAASAQVAGLDGLIAKIQQFNTSLILLGSAMTVTGLIWALMSFTLGMAGGAKAIMVLIGGLGIAVAPQVVAFVTGS